MFDVGRTREAFHFVKVYMFEFFSHKNIKEYKSVRIVTIHFKLTISNILLNGLLKIQ